MWNGVDFCLDALSLLMVVYFDFFLQFLVSLQKSWEASNW